MLVLKNIEYTKVKIHVDNLIKKYKLDFKNLGSKKGFLDKYDLSYCINNDFEIRISSPFKDKTNKLIYSEKDLSTNVIVGKINDDNRELISKIKKDIEVLKID
jgi:hypothetical protein